MSSRDWLFRIQDMLYAIDKIESYIQDMTLAEFILKQLQKLDSAAPKQLLKLFEYKIS